MTYLKDLTIDNPLGVRSKMAADYAFGAFPSDEEEFWRPLDVTHRSSAVFSYTTNDHSLDGVTISDTVPAAPDTSIFTLEGDAVSRFPSLCMYKATYNISANMQDQITYS